jgi:hypothetical protein
MAGKERSHPSPVFRSSCKSTTPLLDAQRIQVNVVSEKFKKVTVIRVGAGLDMRADDTSLEIAELGGSILGNHIQSLDRVHARRKAN